MSDEEKPAKPQKRVNLQPQNIGEEVDLFVNQIDGLAETLPLAARAIQEVRKLSQNKLVEFFKGECTATVSEEKTTYNFDPGQYPKYLSLSRRVERVDAARQVVPRSFLVALVSQFDAFVGRLIRQLFTLKPDAVNSLENVLTYSQLVSFGSLEAAREFVIDKEIDAVLRKSHSEQFGWLEKKFGIKLNVDLPAWPRFIEVQNAATYSCTPAA